MGRAWNQAEKRKRCAAGPMLALPWQWLGKRQQAGPPLKRKALGQRDHALDDSHAALDLNPDLLSAKEWVSCTRIATRSRVRPGQLR